MPTVHHGFITVRKHSFKPSYIQAIKKRISFSATVNWETSQFIVRLPPLGLAIAAFAGQTETVARVLASSTGADAEPTSLLAEPRTDMLKIKDEVGNQISNKKIKNFKIN